MSTILEMAEAIRSEAANRTHEGKTCTGSVDVETNVFSGISTNYLRLRHGVFQTHELVLTPTAQQF